MHRETWNSQFFFEISETKPLQTPRWLPVVDGSKVRVAKTQGATPRTETIFASNELIQWAHFLRCDYS